MRNRILDLVSGLALIVGLGACDSNTGDQAPTVVPVSTDTPTDYLSVVGATPMDWTEPQAWIDSATGEPNGRYPMENDSVVITEGSEIAINAAVSARHVTVNGALTASVSSTTPISLATHYVLVTGPSARFSVGTEATPFTGTFTLELVGVGDSNEPFIDGPNGQERKFLMAMNGGTLSLHGQERISWTHLGGDRMYDAGETSLTLGEEVSWGPGDRIVLAPSVGLAGFEEAEIVAIDGKTLTLARGLAHRHYGGAPRTYQAYDGGPFLTLDQRAEVGLLSRNVRIIGDADSEIAGFGGHVMLMPGAHAQISNTELHRMGQRGSVGRYPIHWHLHGDTNGQSIANSSIHRSYNRAVTLHGTSDVRVERNVAYDIAGHAFFLENGSEERNSFIGNLAIHVYRPDEAYATLESDFAFDEAQNRSPSSFWITNPANTFVGNVAAGSPGTGYWFALRANRDDFAGTGIYGTEKEITRFENNVAHNLMTGIDFHDAIKCEGCLDDLQKNLGWVKVGEPNLIQRFTAYSTDIGIYSGTAHVNGYASANYTVEVRNSILADNINATFFASRVLVSDSVVVAETFHGITSLNQPRTALVLYDGAARFERCHFEGFDSSTQPPTSFAQQVGAAAKNVNWEISECTGDSPRLVWPDYPAFAAAAPNLQNPNFEGNPRSWGTTFFDHTGSFIGAGRSLINNHPMMTAGDETVYTAAGSQNALHTHRRYGHLRVLYGAGFNRPGQQPNVFVTRFDFTGVGPNIGLDNVYKLDPGHQQAIIVSDGESGVEFGYRLDYDDARPLKRIDLELGDCMGAGQQAVIVIAGIGNYEGLSLSGTAVDHYAHTPINVVQVTSPEALLASQVPGYVVDDAGDLWVKLVSQAIGTPLVTTQVRWD